MEERKGLPDRFKNLGPEEIEAIEAMVRAQNHMVMGKIRDIQADLNRQPLAVAEESDVDDFVLRAQLNAELAQGFPQGDTVNAQFAAILVLTAWIKELSDSVQTHRTSAQINEEFIASLQQQLQSALLTVSDLSDLGNDYFGKLDAFQTYEPLYLQEISQLQKQLQEARSQITQLSRYVDDKLDKLEAASVYESIYIEEIDELQKELQGKDRALRKTKRTLDCSEKILTLFWQAIEQEHVPGYHRDEKPEAMGDLLRQLINGHRTGREALISLATTLKIDLSPIYLRTTEQIREMLSDPIGKFALEKENQETVIREQTMKITALEQEVSRLSNVDINLQSARD